MAPSAMPLNGEGYDHPYAHLGASLNGDTNGETKTNGAFPKEPEAVPIAIVGMGCRLPGDVKGAEEFWEFLARARSGWSPIPESRFKHSAFHHPNPDKEGCYNPGGGHFVDEDVGLFDAPFFNITEKEAISMDPQQRLLLECTYEALENAGIPKEKLVKESVGVYVGGSFADYELRNCRDLGMLFPIHISCICIVTVCCET
jgi:acyl transferase domain-containing protein